MMFTGVLVSAACSSRYCATCVVLPEPVSPSTMVTGLSLKALMSAERYLNTGSDRRTAPWGPPLCGAGGANREERT